MEHRSPSRPQAQMTLLSDEPAATNALGTNVRNTWRSRRDAMVEAMPAAVGLPPRSTPMVDLQAIIDEHERSGSSSHHFRPSRLILINCWVLGYQDFPFVDGHLVLNGGNGSGKTTALTAAMPVALFGNTSAGALDTMDGRARTVEYLVLGDVDDVRDKHFIETGRTTQILWEFQQPSTNRYITVGQVLTGTRAGTGGKAGNIEKRGVIIRDGRRIGKTMRFWDFDKNGMMQPWEALDLSTKAIDTSVPIEQRNVVTDSTQEFQRTVAREIFGTDNVREVLAYERTLRAMRRPMLNNKEFKPADVADMLRQSLPELDATILDQLDSSLNGLDQISAQLENLRSELAATTELNELHATMVLARASELAKHVAFYDSQVRGILTQIDGEIKTRDDAKASRAGLFDLIKAGRSEIGGIDGTLEELKKGPNAQIVDRHKHAASAAQQARVTLTSVETRRSRALLRVEGAKRAADEAVGDLVRAIDALRTLATELRSAADDQRWALGREAATRLEAVCVRRADHAIPVVVPQDAPEALVTAANARRDALRLLEQAVVALGKADEELRNARASIDPLESAVTDAETRHRDAADERDRVRDEIADAITAWSSVHVAALPSGTDTYPTASAVRHFEGTEKESRTLLTPLREALRRESEARNAAYYRVDGERKTRQRELDDLDRRLAGERAKKDRTPPVSDAQDLARKALAHAGIDAVPLFAALEVMPGAPAPSIAIIEQVLTETGLLDALLIAPAHAARARATLESAFGSGAADRWLAPSAENPQAENSGSTASLFCPAETTNAAQAVPSVLGCFRMEPVASWDAPSSNPANIWIDLETGRWRHGLAEGRSVTNRTTAEFIGLVNRRAERERRIAALELERETLHDVIKRHDAHLTELDDARKAVGEAQRALDALPGIGRLAAVIDLVRVRLQEFEDAKRKLREVSERMQQLVARRATCAEARAMAALALPEFRESSEADLRHAIGAATGWLNTAKRWPGGWSATHRAHERVTETIAQHDIAETELAEEEESRAVADAALSEAEALARELAIQLESREVRDLQARIAGLEERKTAREKEVKQAERDEAQIDQKITDADKNIDGHRTRLQEPLEARNTNLLVFVGYLRTHAMRFVEPVRDLSVMPDLSTVAITEALATPGVEEAYRNAVRRFEGTIVVSRKMLDEAGKARETARDTWSSAFLTQRVTLDAYAIEWQRDTHIVSAVVGTTPLSSLPALQTHLEQHVATQAAAIQHQEDELYRRIFLEQLSDALRNQIRETKTTVHQLNVVLAQRPLHDGEVLSVQWRPMTIPGRRGRDRQGDVWSNEDDVARRKEVVNILTTRDLANASDEAQDVVYRYFRDRLNFLRSAYGRPGTTPGFSRLDGREVKTFRDVLATAFDYRQWYEFGIMSRISAGEKVQEITGERFHRRSGGQRVAAVLVPLLAALEVRCRAFGATSSAPRFIALDEAFAGVDEENTEALFQTLEGFDMSWIMTSDKLTGASPSLSGSMTAVFRKEVRPDAPSIVAVQYLVWDGTFEFDDETAVFRTAMLANGGVSPADRLPVSPTE